MLKRTTDFTMNDVLTCVELQYSGKHPNLSLLCEISRHVDLWEIKNSVYVFVRGNKDGSERYLSINYFLKGNSMDEINCYVLSNKTSIVNRIVKYLLTYFNRRLLTNLQQ